MYHFSTSSLSALNSCHMPLQELAKEILKYTDCKVLYGSRGRGEQNRLYKLGRSTKQFPHSKHNHYPSLAMDIIPYPVIWPNVKDSIEKYTLELGRMYMFVGLARGIAFEKGIDIRVGADWDGDFILTDQTFHDLAHIELKGDY